MSTSYRNIKDTVKGINEVKKDALYYIAIISRVKWQEEKQRVSKSERPIFSYPIWNLGQ